MSAGMTTSEGSPRAALLQQAVSRGQRNAAMSPLSALRPPVHGQAQYAPGVMTFMPRSTRGKANVQGQSQMLALVMHLLKSRGGM